MGSDHIVTLISITFLPTNTVYFNTAKMWFYVSDPNTYLVITGAGIDTVKIQKKAFVLPFQRVTKISITPFDFSMSLHAMTSEKLKFSLPAVFTIGPRGERERGEVCSSPHR